LQAQLTQTYAIQNIPAPVITARNKRYRKSYLQTQTGSPGHKPVLHNFSVAMYGRVSPYRTRAADIGNVKSNETEFRVKENKN